MIFTLFLRGHSLPTSSATTLLQDINSDAKQKRKRRHRHSRVEPKIATIQVKTGTTGLYHIRGVRFTAPLPTNTDYFLSQVFRSERHKQRRKTKAHETAQAQQSRAQNIHDPGRDGNNCVVPLTWCSLYCTPSR